MTDKLSELIDKFDHGALMIDINVGRNPGIWQDCEELGSLLDRFSSRLPYSEEPWSEYIPPRIDEWEYIMCHVRDGVIQGTATDQFPEDKEVISTRDFIEIANECASETIEDFESILN